MVLLNIEDIVELRENVVNELSASFEAAKTTISDIETAQAEYRQKAKALFRSSVNDIFDTYPVLEKFSWSQYTPYFNDGDVCEFSLYEDTITVNDFDPNGGNDEDLLVMCQRYEDPVTKKVSYPSFIEADNLDIYCAFETVQKFISLWSNDMMKDIFGDHAYVTIYRDGTVVVEEYEHD